ncbi:ABC-2 type transport system permease protein [Sinomonas atrocyanea]|uniref:ABC transporter permease n=1 Tax=Sinomonas atrocyanea TaxID=37927 RepID=UPI00277F145B|nr:ABC transporter permease [Sinomonas atrocyanea]MDP9884275.1 ABC-2 type transport system permease protein [Sinomonas atrocyanea]
MASIRTASLGTVSLGAVSLGTIGMVWQRELLRYVRTPSRIFTGLAQPLLFLFVLGYGMGSLVGSTGGLDFRMFVFPGIVAMSVVSTSIFSAISIVWDREFGFLREMLVAPVPRWALVMGKTAGGATVATGQGTIMLVLAPLVGVDLTVLTIAAVIAIEFVMAAALTAFGVFVASRITRMEGFQMVMQLVLLPMIFLSGALFPLAGLPLWLDILTRLNPLTYAVAPLRSVVFGAQNLPAAALARFPSDVTLFGWTLSVWTELAITVVFAAVFLALAVRGFGRRL